MPVINFTTGDFLKSKILEGEQWYSWQIASVSPFRANENKDGYNWDVVFTLVEHPTNPDMNGKEVKRTFSTKANGFAIDLALAAQGLNKQELKPEEFAQKFASFDFDTVVGKKIDGKCKVDNYNGQLNNKVEEYAPYKTMVGKGPSF